jgi:Uncharacterized conserved protein
VLVSDVPPTLDAVNFAFPVEWGKCRELALALLDPDPAMAFSDDPGVVAPVLPVPVIQPVCSFRYGPENAPPIVTMSKRGMVDRSRLLQGGLDFEFHRPIRSGDTLAVTERLANTYDKKTSKGVLRFLEFEAVFRTPEGELVCTVITTNIERRPGDDG